MGGCRRQCWSREAGAGREDEHGSDSGSGGGCCCAFDSLRLPGTDCRTPAGAVRNSEEPRMERRPPHRTSHTTPSPNPTSPHVTRAIHCQIPSSAAAAVCVCACACVCAHQARTCQRPGWARQQHVGGGAAPGRPGRRRRRHLQLGGGWGRGQAGGLAGRSMCGSLVLPGSLALLWAELSQVESIWDGARDVTPLHMRGHSTCAAGLAVRWRHCQADE